MLTVTGKALGSRKPLFADFSVPPPEDARGGGETTLRDLIESVVRHEVAAFHQRQEERQFLRVLTSRQVNEGAARGKIDSGGRQADVQRVDADEAIGTALQAFEDGLYFVILDEDQLRELDARVVVQSGSRLTFVRLTQLAGG